MPWKVTFPDEKGEPLGVSYWPSFQRADENVRYLDTEYGIDAQIEFEPEVEEVKEKA